jgi:hypothetical protein
MTVKRNWPTANPLNILINQLRFRRNAAGKPILHETSRQYDLTIGQVRFLHSIQVTLLMKDDEGYYELVEGLDNRVTKRRV